MSEDVDYEPDVLQFKHVWAETKLPQDNQPNKKNLQTIESTTKNVKRKHSVNKNKSQKKHQPQEPKIIQTKTKQKQSTKKIQQTTKQVLRNPKQSENVIQVSTQPQKFYHTSFENQKNNIAKSHLYFDHHKVTGNNFDTNIQGTISQFEIKKLLEQKDYELSMLRVTNLRNQDRIRILQKQLQSKNQIISQLRDRERKIIGKNCDLQSKQINFDYGKAEYQNFRNDSRRLLRMLQSTAQYKEFANFALDDDGVRFLTNVNKNKKSKIDTSPSNYVQTLHYCTCNKQFNPESGFWIPQKVYDFGKQFVKSRKGELTEPELEFLLYELNRIWRERQKRIINTFEGMKAHEVGKLKRMIKNLEGKKDGRSKSTKRSVEKLNQQNQQ